MKTLMNIKIREQFGRACVDYEEGELLYQLIQPAVQAGDPLHLDFEGVDLFASPYFNASLARLVLAFPDKDLNSLLHISNILPVGWETAKRSIDNAKDFVRHPERQQELDEVLSEIDKERS